MRGLDEPLSDCSANAGRVVDAVEGGREDLGESVGVFS